MQIELSPDQYRTLLDVLAIADWVKHIPKPDQADTAFVDLEQQVLAAAPRFGCERLVEFYPAERQHVLTEGFQRESTAVAEIDEYNDYMFWEELVARLVERDLAALHGVDELDSMDLDERAELDQEAEGPYWDEFERHGIDHVEIRFAP